MEKRKSFQKLCQKHGVDFNFIPEITSFEDACKVQNIDPKKLPIVTGLSDRYQKRIIADYKLSVIADALRGGKDVSYLDSSSKYFPVFRVMPIKRNLRV